MTRVSGRRPIRSRRSRARVVPLTQVPPKRLWIIFWILAAGLLGLVGRMAMRPTSPSKPAARIQKMIQSRLGGTWVRGTTRARERRERMGRRPDTRVISTPPGWADSPGPGAMPWARKRRFATRPDQGDQDAPDWPPALAPDGWAAENAATGAAPSQRLIPSTGAPGFGLPPAVGRPQSSDAASAA